VNYYNDNDPKACAWIHQLITDGLIPPGDVDSRSITEISPHDLTGYTQLHFFAGISGWPLALRIAGWPDDKPVRTGSCPCQPFSSGGKRRGTADKRHLWPVFRDLITFGEPTETFGEQVASPLGREWFSGVRADLEGLGYEVGGADLCAAGAGSPQIRQRIFWVASPNRQRLKKRSKLYGDEKQSELKTPQRNDALRCGDPTRVGNTDITGSQRRGIDWHRSSEWAPWSAGVGVCGNDGEWRRIEPGIPPVAPRLPSRVALIRGSGNAIVPQIAAQFILSYLEATNHQIAP
jgi:DNA (cytosine-5)-methyltransferase 1